MPAVQYVDGLGRAEKSKMLRPDAIIMLLASQREHYGDARLGWSSPNAVTVALLWFPVVRVVVLAASPPKVTPCLRNRPPHLLSRGAPC